MKELLNTPSLTKEIVVISLFVDNVSHNLFVIFKHEKIQTHIHMAAKDTAVARNQLF